MPRSKTPSKTDHYFVPEVPITLDDDADWIKKISRKFTKNDIVEKLNTINVDSYNPKASKKKLVETLLYNLREQIDDAVDQEDGDDDAGGAIDEGGEDEEEDEPYDPQEDPAYRSSLDGDLEEEEENNEEEEEEEDEDEDEDDDTFVARMQKKLGLTNSNSNYFISNWTDPTLLFCGGTLMSVVFVRGDSSTNTLSFVPMKEYPSQLYKHFVDPAFVAGALFLFVAYYMTKDYVHDRFSATQRREAGWYLWNGAIIHVMMDGMAGGGWLSESGGWGLKLMNENYQVLDKRFSREATKGDIAVAATVTQTELCVHSVLTLYAYVGLCKRARWADSVALIALSFQLFGAIMFIGPDLMLGCPNMQPFDQLTCTPGISWFEVFYFWFGVTVNVVWIIIPMILMKNIIQRSIQNN